MRVLLALGGNAMTNADGRARPEDQIAAAQVAMAAVAGLLEHDHEVVITHGNGPQVGNLLVKNELAAAVVPPVPLDWCGAQTQATLGFVLMDALDRELAPAAIDRRSAARRHPDARRRRRRGLHHADQADRAPPARGRGQGPDGPRRDLGGPRREGLAPRRRLARAAGDPRRPRRARADRGRLRRRRQRWWRHPARTPSRRVARRRRGRHRQGPRRRPARRDHRRRRARHRHRRAERRHPLGRARRRAARPR